MSKKVCVTLLLILLIIQIIYSYERLELSISYYQALDNNVIEAFNWISANVPENTTIFINNDILQTWLEAYTHRLAIANKPLFYVVTKNDATLTSYANIISLGNYVLESKNLFIADDFPYGYSTPGIYIKTADYYLPLIYLYDEAQTFNFSSSFSNMLSAPIKKIFDITQNMNVISITYKYAWDFGEVFRTISLTSEQNISISYLLKLYKYSINELDIRVFISQENIVENVSHIGNLMKLSLLTPNGKIDVFMNFLATSPIKDLRFNTNDPKYKLSSITVVLTPENPKVGVTIEVNVWKVEANSYVKLYNSYELMKLLNIEYIFIDKDKSYSDYIRFNFNPYFSKTFENDRIAIFRYLQNVINVNKSL
jgi:hypothetical protein